MSIVCQDACTMTDSVKTPVHVSAMHCLDGTGLIPECEAHCGKKIIVRAQAEESFHVASS